MRYRASAVGTFSEDPPTGQLLHHPNGVTGEPVQPRRTAFWLLLIVVIPLVGVLIYVIARGDEMKAQRVSDERQQEIASTAELEDLRDRGILTDEELQRVKR